MKHLINDIASVILTTTVYLLGGFDIALQSLIIVIIIDYLTGIASAIYNKNLKTFKEYCSGNYDIVFKIKGDY